MFESAYFGKSYRTRDGRRAIYMNVNDSNIHSLIIENDILSHRVYWDDGHHLYDKTDDNHDIVGEWETSLSHEQITRIAERANPYPEYNPDDICEEHRHVGFTEGFVEGYNYIRNGLK